MKQTFLALILILSLLMTLGLSAYADSFPGATSWYAEFQKGDKLVSNFGAKAIDETLKNLQPGDDVTFTITLKNTSEKIIDWYMANEVIKTLEDSSSANGGAYSYELTYSPSKGGTTTIYSSNKVGGEKQKDDEPIGLKQVNAALKDYFELETMRPGKTGTVVLKVKFDGETQGNIYQDTDAQFRMLFAVEITPTGKIIKTGDDAIKVSPFYIGMAVSGLAFMALAVDGFLQRKKKGGESK